LCASRFDRTAERYAEAAREKDWASFVDFCHPDPADRALDVGAGPAILSGALRPRIAEAVAVDPSSEMLAYAPAGVVTVVGEGERLPFEDDAFTLVTCVNTLHHVRDAAATLAEIARVLAPGGRLVAQDYLADHDPDRAQQWETVERLRDPGHGRLPAEGEVQQALEPLGLRLDEEQSWESVWELEPWIEMAAPPEPAADRIRRLVGADRFTLRAWRARFVNR
jgi:SAM-dependent methyltransferase